MFSKLIAGTVLLFSMNSFAQNCETLEEAKIALVNHTALGQYPFSGNYTVKDFSELKAIEDTHEVFCHPNGEDCGDTDIDFGMKWSFEPGMRGWIGITTNCEIDYAVTFRD